jgi:putative colanic acid biosynthesis UDP-glucose lipid carrier transferase
VQTHTDPLPLRLIKAPVAETRFFAAYAFADTLLEPLVMVASLWLVALVFERGLNTSYLVLSLLVFAITCPSKIRNRNSIRDLCAQVLSNWALVLPVLLFSLWVTDLLGGFSSNALLLWAVAAPALLIGANLLLRSFLPKMTGLHDAPRRCVIAGMNEQSLQLATRQAADPLNEYRTIGFFDDRPQERLPDSGTFSLLGRLEDLPEFVKRNQIHIVYLSLPLTTDSRIATILEGLRNTTASIHLILDTVLIDLVQGRLGTCYGVPTLSICESPFIGLDAAAKRLFDVVASALIILAVSPLLVAIAVAVKFSSPGPIIFRQRRYGLNGEEIMVYKFRSMSVTEDGEKSYTQVKRNDSRVTQLGAFLRKTSLDELPQFFNVLNGSMSIVGPRPHAIAVNEHYRKEISGYMIRHKVRPGITGWAQVNGFRGGDDIDSMRSRVEYDIDYLRHWSPGLDLYIIARTLLVVYRDQKAY